MRVTLIDVISSEWVWRKAIPMSQFRLGRLHSRVVHHLLTCYLNDGKRALDEREEFSLSF